MKAILAILVSGFIAASAMAGGRSMRPGGQVRNSVGISEKTQTLATVMASSSPKGQLPSGWEQRWESGKEVCYRGENTLVFDLDTECLEIDYNGRFTYADVRVSGLPAGLRVANDNSTGDAGYWCAYWVEGKTTAKPGYYNITITATHPDSGRILYSTTERLEVRDVPTSMNRFFCAVTHAGWAVQSPYEGARPSGCVPVYFEADRRSGKTGALKMVRSSHLDKARIERKFPFDCSRFAQSFNPFVSGPSTGLLDSVPSYLATYTNWWDSKEWYGHVSLHENRLELNGYDIEPIPVDDMGYGEEYAYTYYTPDVYPVVTPAEVRLNMTKLEFGLKNFEWTMTATIGATGSASINVMDLSSNKTIAKGSGWLVDAAGSGPLVLGHLTVDKSLTDRYGYLMTLSANADNGECSLFYRNDNSGECLNTVTGRFLNCLRVEAKPRCGGRVSGGGFLGKGAKTTLKATPERGYIFAGWYDEDNVPLSGSADYRTATFPTVASGLDTVAIAKFVTPEEDQRLLSVPRQDFEESSFAAGEPLSGVYRAIKVNSLSLPRVSVKGLPPGMRFNSKTLMIEGAATKPGVYSVTVSATNLSVKKAVVYTADLKIRNYQSDFLPLDDTYAGLIPGESPDNIEFPLIDGATVSGLPPGMRYNSKTGEITGAPTKPGRYTVIFKRRIKHGDGSVTNETASATFDVADFPKLTVVANNSAYGTVRGGGSYPAHGKVTLSATPAKGYVFAGWYTSPDLDYAAENRLHGAVDYRTPTFPYEMTSATHTTLYARFESSLDDVLLFPEQEFEWTPEKEFGYAAGRPLQDAEGNEGVSVVVESLSLPKMNVKGLPQGVKFDTKSLKLIGVPTNPGIYTLEIGATNAAVKKASVYRANLRVLNYRSEYIPVKDTYGPFVPGVDISETGADLRVEADAVKGLPPGLKFDAQFGRVVGTPQKPGNYTVLFTKRVQTPDGKFVTETASTTMMVASFPTLEVLCLDPVAGKVSGSGAYPAGASVMLKATPSKGHVFAGWYHDWSEAEGFSNPLEAEDGTDYRSPSFSYTTGAEKDDVFARFVPASLDCLEVFPNYAVSPDGVAYVEWDPNDESGGIFEEPLYILSNSLVKVSVSGLPAGMTFDPKSFVLSGKPTVPGLYTVVFTVTNTTIVRPPRIVTVKATVKDLRGEGIADGLTIDGLYPGAEIAPIRIPAGMRVSGLPPGMRFNPVTGLIEGAPYAPGRYIVYFTQVIGGRTVVATKTVEVAPYPELTIIGNEIFGTVSGGGGYPVGAIVTLKATPKKGFVFAGWYVDSSFDVPLPSDFGSDNPFVSGVDYRSPTFPFRMPSMDVSVSARFVPMATLPNTELWPELECDRLSIPMEQEISSAPLELNREMLPVPLEILSFSLPKVSVQGLPPGLRFDAGTFFVCGTPIKPGDYDVTVSAVNASGLKDETTLLIRVTHETGIGRINNGEPFVFDPGESIEIGIEGLSLSVLDEDVTVSGLPIGVRYDSVTHRIVGAAKVSGAYTLVFKAHAGISTCTLRIRSNPEIKVVSRGTMGTVSGSGRYPVNTKVTLKATPAKGYLFVGWFRDEHFGSPLFNEADADGSYEDFRSPEFVYTVRANAGKPDVIYAQFICEEGVSEIDIPMISVYGSEDLGSVPVLTINDPDFSASLQVGGRTMPKVEVAGLPAGMTFDRKRLSLSGMPYEPGVYSVRFAATNAVVTKATPETTQTVLIIRDGRDDLGLGNSYSAPIVVRNPMERNEIDLLHGASSDGVTVSGELPPGMVWDPVTGKLCGVPYRHGLYAVKVECNGKVSDIGIFVEITEPSAQCMWELHSPMYAYVGENTRGLPVMLTGFQGTDIWPVVRYIGLPGGLKAETYYDSPCGMGGGFYDMRPQAVTYVTGTPSAAPGRYPIIVLIEDPFSGKVTSQPAEIRIQTLPCLMKSRYCGINVGSMGLLMGVFARAERSGPKQTLRVVTFSSDENYNFLYSSAAMNCDGEASSLRRYEAVYRHPDSKAYSDWMMAFHAGGFIMQRPMFPYDGAPDMYAGVKVPMDRIVEPGEAGLAEGSAPVYWPSMDGGLSYGVVELKKNGDVTVLLSDGSRGEGSLVQCGWMPVYPQEYELRVYVRRTNLPAMMPCVEVNALRYDPVMSCWIIDAIGLNP